MERADGLLKFERVTSRGINQERHVLFAGAGDTKTFGIGFRELADLIAQPSEELYEQQVEPSPIIYRMWWEALPIASRLPPQASAMDVPSLLQKGQ
jgi:hypothetical protein